MGDPPRAGVPTFRLLFLIVREPPPQLEGHFSEVFRDFVTQCLQKAPEDRPSAIDLLMHPFVLQAELPLELTDHIAERLKEKKQQKENDNSLPVDADSVLSAAGAIPVLAAAAPTETHWDFPTVKARPRPPPTNETSANNLASPDTPPFAYGTVIHRGVNESNGVEEGGNQGRLPPPGPPADEPQRRVAAMGDESVQDPSKIAVPSSKRGTSGTDARKETLSPAAAASVVAEMAPLLGKMQQCAAVDELGKWVSETESSAKDSLSQNVDLGPLGNVILGRWREGQQNEVNGKSS